MNTTKAAFKSGYKNDKKSKLLPRYEAGVEYAITINPKEIEHVDYWNFEECDQTIRSYILDMHHKLVRMTDIVKMRLYLEFARTGRLHYHGVFTIEDKNECNFLRLVIPAFRDLAQICIKEVKDGKHIEDGYEQEDGEDTPEKEFNTWLEYCTKNSKQVEDAEYPVFIDNYPKFHGTPAAAQISKVRKASPRIRCKRERLNN